MGAVHLVANGACLIVGGRRATTLVVDQFIVASREDLSFCIMMSVVEEWLPWIQYNIIMYCTIRINP